MSSDSEQASDKEDLNDSLDDISEDALTNLWLKFEREHPVTPAERQGLLEVFARRDKIALPVELEHEIETTPGLSEGSTAVINPAIAPLGPVAAEPSQDLRNAIDQMLFSEKVKLALFGNKQARAILILDKSRIIQQFVLRNPRIQIQEIEEFAKNTNMSEIVLRVIADKREWMRSYNIKRALVFNARTPIDVSMRWLKFINNDDMKLVSRSKNLPQVIVTQAKKVINKGQ